MQVEISKEQWVEWKNHPVTNQVMQALKLERENLKELIANDNIAATEIAKVIGMCFAYKKVLDVELDVTDSDVIDGEVVND